MVVDRQKTAQLVICLAFLLGAITGGLAIHLYYSYKPQTSNGVIEITHELTTKVGLSEAQHSKVIDLLTESRKQRSELYKQLQPQLITLRDSTRAKIRAILTFEQSAKYDQWIQELDAKRLQKAHEASTK